MPDGLAVAGASRGIGRVAAAHILRRSPDAHLLVVTRGTSGTQLATELAAGGHAVSHVSADLGSLGSVRAAATEIRGRLGRGDLPPLRGFVGNAGIQYTNALTEGPDGFETTFTVNVLANHLFVRLLQDHFAAPGRPRPRGAFPRADTAVAGGTAYSTSKLAAIYLVHGYARRLPAGIDAVTYNPGFVPGTGLARHADPVSRFAMRRILPMATLTPFATGRNAVGRYLADVVLGTTGAPTGSYVDRNRVDRSSEESYDPRREVELWDAAERLTAA
ncbi:SDR family NAD(P)-dependent oxidoreductase [Streptomyces sp. NPDC050416]|uniref:SDR family NAD(P)-dependent oxidoreductase n=1 Tax=Streptomyces sp. NPDC050416 TaxID=3365611 RepID=UPI00379FD367